MASEITGVLKYTAGDTSVLTIEYIGDVAPIDITGYTITVRLKYADETVLEKPATIIDAVNGVASIQWAAGELTAGKHYLEFELDDGAGLVMTFPTAKPVEVYVRSTLEAAS